MSRFFKIVICTALASVVFYCTNSSRKTADCLLIDLKNGEMVRALECKLHITQKGSKFFFNYSPKDSLSYCIAMLINDTTASYSHRDKDLLEYIGSKTFVFKNKQYKVLKFNYDIENSGDEESLYFFEKDLGLIMINNYSWNDYRIFKTPSIPDSLINTIFLPENIAFWNDPYDKGDINNQK